jgi:glycosyltransferase involved in cell wall biosynthesis
VKKPSVSFLIPAYNDENTIQTVVLEAFNVGKKVASEFEIIVIDDASIDLTCDALTRLKKKIPELRVIEHEENQGYGGTIRELYYEGNKDLLYSMPGDYQIGASEIVKLLPFIEKADMVLGLRVHRHDPPARLRQSRIYNTLLRFMFNMTIQDVNSVRLMKRDMITKITLASTSAFVDAELAIRAQKQGFTILEIPIEHRARAGEDGAGGGKWWTILPVILDMIVFRLQSYIVT